MTERSPPASTSRPSIPEGRAHSPPRVLLAEDDPDMRRLVTEALVADGCTVDAVPDGGRLLVLLTKLVMDDLSEVDLIVSDIRMPVASGLQIVEALRAAHRWTPVILMTAFGDEATRAHAERVGAVLFDKPFELADLRSAVARLLRRAA